jgi:phosphohistidine swiveling domain-containing protein
MNKRLLIQIPSEQLENLEGVKSIRKDLADFPISKIVHFLLQERIAQIFQGETEIKGSALKQKGEWIEYIREKIPLHTLAPIVIGMIRSSPEMIGKGFSKVMFYVDHRKTLWCESHKDMEVLGKFLLSNLTKKDFSQEHYTKYLKIYTELCSFSGKCLKTNWTTTSEEDLISSYSKMYELLKKSYGLSLDIDVIDIVLEQKIKNLLRECFIKKGKDNQKFFSEKYSVLTSPKEQSYVQKEEFEKLKISQEIKESSFWKRLSLSNASFEKLPSIYQNKILQLEERYWWVELGWLGGERKDAKRIWEEIKKIILSEEKLSLRIKEYPLKLSSIEKEKTILAKEFNFDQELKQALIIFERYALLHDYRKEMQVKSNYAFYELLREIARRYNWKYEDLLWCWPSEIQELVHNKNLPQELIEERQKELFVLVDEKNIEEVTGERARRRKEQEVSGDGEKASNFYGMSASSGKVTGRAKVCYSPQEAISKVNEGDILITSMTTPDYLFVMKKAAAIVTNEGGITCHAAIVAREFGIPCIVGTTCATKMINDNDLIEVNANHGVVKVLERSKQ